MNTYTEKYNALIAKFRECIPDKSNEYCERHDIIPKSCGGTNKKENIVLLPGRWHFIAHYLLPFVMLERGDKVGYEKMCMAFNRMANCSFSNERIQETKETLAIKALGYEAFRTTLNKLYEKRRLGSIYNPHTYESRNKIRNTMKVENSTNPRIWVSGEGKTKYIRKELLQEYLNKGWELGRINYKPRKNKQGSVL